jgi:hypothetical protein
MMGTLSVKDKADFKQQGQTAGTYKKEDQGVVLCKFM